MLITIDRAWKKDGYTISRLYVNGELFGCNTLEDADRGLRQDMQLEEIKKKKVYGQTAIPSGSYECVYTYSNRFKKMLPLLKDVPGFDGIRIHSGNSAKDTEGCILIGKNDKKGWVSNSRFWTNKLIQIMKTAWDKKEKVTIVIQQLMKLIDKITRVVIAIAVAMLILSMFCRCTTTKYVPVTEYKDRVVVKTDSLLKTDSVYVHDSVSVYIRGDTVFKDKYHLQYKDRYIVRSKSDTLIVRDSVPYKVVIENQLSKTDRAFLNIGKIASVCLFIGILAFLGWIYWKLKLHKHSQFFLMFLFGYWFINKKG